MKIDPRIKKYGPWAALAIVLTAVAAASGSGSEPAPSKGGGSNEARTLRNIADLHPKMRAAAARFLGACKKQGIDVIITSSLRTYAEQTALYAQGRTKPGGIVTNAKAGESYHNFGLAFDCVAIVNGKPDWNGPWQRMGEIGKSVGLEWGGDFKSFVDRPHFQMRFNKTTAQLRAMIKAGQATGPYPNV